MRALPPGQSKGGGVNNKTGRWGGYGGAACQVGRSHKHNGSEVFYGFLFGKVKKMTKNKGFTLIELMVVILIVAILAAVLAPMLTGRIREAKWTEGKAGAGTISTALRAYLAEVAGDNVVAVIPPTMSSPFTTIGVLDSDLAGKYFVASNYAVSGITYTPTTGAMTYVITVTAPATIGGTGKTLTVNSAGAAGATSVWADL